MAQKTYRVSGKRAFRGTKPGDEFKADDDDGAIERAIARGNIKAATKSEASSPPKDKE